MISCDDALLQQWQPDFSSSGSHNPTWTKVSCGGVVMCNALEWVDWLENPVQVILCDACGHNGCASGGYVHVSRVGDRLLWTRPQVDQADSWERDQFEAVWSVRRFGAVVIGLPTWERWREAVPSLPPVDQIAVAAGRELIDAWFMGARAAHRAASADELIASLRRRVLASDSLDANVAVDRVRDVLDDLFRRQTNPIQARLVRAVEIGARIEVLYFDGPSEEDWPALAFVGAQVLPAFSREWVLVPEYVPGV